MHRPSATLALDEDLAAAHRWRANIYAGVKRRRRRIIELPLTDWFRRGDPGSEQPLRHKWGLITMITRAAINTVTLVLTDVGGGDRL